MMRGFTEALFVVAPQNRRASKGEKNCATADFFQGQNSLRLRSQFFSAIIFQQNG
jgi:hypothetical protein